MAIAPPSSGIQNGTNGGSANDSSAAVTSALQSRSAWRVLRPRSRSTAASVNKAATAVSAKLTSKPGAEEPRMAERGGHQRVQHAPHDDGHADERPSVRRGGLLEAHRLLLPRRRDGTRSCAATARFAMRKRSVSMMCDGQMTSQQPHSMQSCRPSVVERVEVGGRGGDEQILRQQSRRADQRAVAAADARPLVRDRA